MKTVNRISNTVAIISVIAYFIETALNLQGTFGFLTLERLIAAFFTVEVAYQLNRDRSYWKTGEFVIDMLSILPFYLGFFVSEQYMEYVRTLRVLRLLKLFWYNDSFSVMKNAFVMAWPSLKSVGFCMICLCLFSAALLYQVEKETFGNIGNAVYFVMTTTTTIGFGDFSPKSPIGKLITVGLLYGPSLIVCGSMVGVACSSYQVSLENHRKKNEQ
jgi:voltage-gated potassium channel